MIYSQRFFSLVAILFLALGTQSQDTTRFELNGHNIKPEADSKSFFSSKKDFKTNYYNDYYYVIVQFEDTPSSKIFRELEPDLYSLKKIDKKTYQVALYKNFSKRNIKKHGIHSIINIDYQWKIHNDLTGSSSKSLIDKDVDLKISFSKSVKDEDIEDFIKDNELTLLVKQYQSGTNVYEVATKENKIEEIAKYPWIVHVGPR